MPASVLKELPVGDGGCSVAAVFDAKARWAVPVFVMISGALLLDPDNREGLGAFYRKRLARIGLPLLIWTVFYLLWLVAKGFAGGEPVGLSELGRRVVTGLPYYHMWFLFMIAGLYAFVLFFLIVAAHAIVSELKFLVCAMFVPAALNAIVDKAAQESFTPFFVSFVPYIPYFFLGRLIRTGGFALQKRLAWAVYAGSGALAALGC